MKFAAATPVQLHDWLERKVAEFEKRGHCSAPLIACAAGAGMIEFWRITAVWPLDAVKDLIDMAARLAQRNIPDILAEPPLRRIGLATPQYMIAHSAEQFADALAKFPEAATELIGEPPGNLVDWLSRFVSLAAEEAEQIRSTFDSLPPPPVQSSHDRKGLAYRAAIQRIVENLRAAGCAVTLAQQDRLVATLTNVMLCPGAQVTAESEKKRRTRRNEQHIRKSKGHTICS